LRRVEAEQALSHYERVYQDRAERGVGPGNRPGGPAVAGRMAVAAYEAGRLVDATRYANEALNAAKRWQASPSNPVASLSAPLNEEWMRGHEVLGRLALRDDKVEDAERHLLSMFDLGYSMVGLPRFDLARELVEGAHRDAVIAYLGMCEHVRPKRRLNLAQWRQEVESGSVPSGWRTHPPS
jgi:hypothetical protein